MAALLDWARTLAVTLVFAGLAELLCPEGPLKRESRLGLGLVVLAVLLGPLVSLAPAAFASEAGALWQAVAAPTPARPVPVLPFPGPGSPPLPGPAGGAAPEVGAGAAAPPSPTAPSGSASEFAAEWREVYLAMLDARLAALAETVPGVRGASVSAELSGPGPGWGRIARLAVAIEGDPQAAPVVRDLLAREAGLSPDSVRVTVRGGPSG